MPTRTASTSLVTRLMMRPSFIRWKKLIGWRCSPGEDVGPQRVDDGLADLERVALPEVEHRVGQDRQRA
jgi:hypothetical protein